MTWLLKRVVDARSLRRSRPDDLRTEQVRRNLLAGMSGSGWIGLNLLEPRLLLSANEANVAAEQLDPDNQDAAQRAIQAIIIASDPRASEAGDPGRFTLTPLVRNNGAELARIPFLLQGTATAGRDF